jgi:tetratricopeptide (TPR) repeat protein
MVQLKQAERLIPALDSAKTIFHIYQYIGWINENSGANELALQYQNRALKYAMTYGKPEYIVDVLVNKANTFFNMELPDSARNATKTAMLYYHKVGRGQQSVIQKHLAHYDLLRDSLASAEHHAYQAFMLAQDSSALGNALTLLSQIYTRQNQPEKVRLVMSMMSKKSNSTMAYNRLLAETHLHETHGDYRKAYESMLRLKALDDSLYSEKTHTDIIKVQNDYDNAVLQLDRARQRYRYSVVIIALLLLLFVLSYWYYRRNHLLYKRFQEQIADIKDELHTRLSAKNLTIEEMKQAMDSRLLVDLTACSEQQNAFAFSLSAMPLRSMMQKNVSLGVSANDWLLSSSASSASILGMMLATATCSFLPNWLMLPLCRVASSTSMPSLICATDS